MHIWGRRSEEREVIAAIATAEEEARFGSVAL